MSLEEYDKYFNELKKEGHFSGQMLKYFSENFDERFWRALKAVVDGQVKKYVFYPSGRQIWIIVGKKRDYMILEDFYCACEDFYLNVVIRLKNKVCYHILAKKIAEALNLFEEIKIEDLKYEILINEWKQIEDN